MVKAYALSVRIDDDVKAGLDRAAAVDRRTVASLVNKILADWVAENAPPVAVARRKKGVAK
jgi:predicted transcriptional regulator